MNVASLVASVSRLAGGLFSSVQRLCEDLAALDGLSVQAFGLEDPYTEADRGAWKGIPVRVSGVRGPKMFGYAPGLHKLLEEAELDLLHVHGLWMYPSVACQRWARKRGGRYIVNPHGMLDPWALRNSLWKKRLAGLLYENAHLRGAACLSALCDSEARSIRAYGLRNPVAVIPNGVDFPEGRATAPPPWDGVLPAGAKVLLYLGRLHPKKGLPNLLRAWAGVDARLRQEWSLVIAGWNQGNHEAELSSLAQELGMAGSVLCPGPLFGQAKDASFRRASAFVLPSFSEGLPVTVLEAWAYGLPVVMTPECNLPEGFEASAAIAIAPEVNSIAKGLRELFDMGDAERQAMGDRGRRLVAQRFAWRKIAAQMKEVYEWVLGGGPKPECVRTD